MSRRDKKRMSELLIDAVRWRSLDFVYLLGLQMMRIFFFLLLGCRGWGEVRGFF